MATGDCVPSADNVCRATLDLMPEGTSLWMYVLTAVAVLIAIGGFYQRFRVWRMGRDWKPGDLWAGLKRFVVALATHRKFQQDKKPGTMHAWIFFGFVALFITTTIVAIDADVFELLLDSKLLDDGFYLFLEVFADTFGVVFLAGLLYAFWRRYAERPPQLHRTKPHEAGWLKWMDGDFYALLFLFGVGVTGFVMEGMRLQHQIQTDGITHASYSYVGNAVGLLFAGLGPAQLAGAYPVLWWVHFVLWTSILAILPWTKLNHIVTSSLNILLIDPKRQARPELSKPFDLQQMMESGDLDMPDVGVSTIRDFTWKDRLAFDACTNCGRCEAQCPATAAGRPLSPRKLIQDLKGQMWDDYRAERKARRGGRTGAGAEGASDIRYEPPKVTADPGMATAIDETTLWSCTTCRACVTACPVDINHVDMIVDMRRALVNDSQLDEHQQNLLVNLTNAGNPYGFPASDRDDWTNGLPAGVKVPRASEKAAKGEPVDVIWWVGCSGSYDPRNQEVTRSIATILNAADVEFAILGPEERCNGDPARRLGEEGRFQQSVMENLEVLQQYGAKTIIAQCPHCFNTLQNEYPQFGAEWDVIHHTQLIERLVEEGKVPLKDGAKMDIAYHDSCYLGRHNDIFDAPRRVLQETNGLPVLEMAQSREEGLCCGAGGSNMWYEVKDEDERINVIRAKQAADTGATKVATACPFCLTMINDGLSLTGNDTESGGTMVAQDLAEIVAEHLDWTPPEPEPEEDDGEDGAAGQDLGGGAMWVG